jgi:hypothetical protein
MSTVSNPVGISQTPYEVPSFTGMSPFTVKIDETPELAQLISQAEQCQDLPFEEKLQKIQTIALHAMTNAYEYMKNPPVVNLDFDLLMKCTSLVEDKHSLGDALQAKAGCCRYQSTLFFLLGAAAKLGDKHYLQSTPIHSTLDTCFNDIFHKGKVYHVSIFSASVENKAYDYSAHLGPQIFDQPRKVDAGQPFLAYTVDEEGKTHKYVRQGTHFDS